MINKPLKQLFTAMNNAKNVCSADESIGYKAAVKALYYFIGKTTWINYEVEIDSLERTIREQNLKLDDYAHIVSKLRLENNQLKQKFECKSIQRKIGVNYSVVSLEINGLIIPEFYMEITQEELDQELRTATEHVFKRKVKRHPEQTIRCRLIDYFRSKGFKVTV